MVGRGSSLGGHGGSFILPGDSLVVHIYSLMGHGSSQRVRGDSLGGQGGLLRVRSGSLVVRIGLLSSHGGSFGVAWWAVHC